MRMLEIRGNLADGLRRRPHARGARARSTRWRRSTTTARRSWRRGSPGVTARARNKQRIDVSRSRTPHSADADHGAGRARRRVRRQRDSRATCSGSGSRAPGPAARPDAPVEKSIRNIAYALLSGADGWMFDGEDALGQVVDDVARQPAQPQAGDPPRPGVPEGRRAGGRRDEPVGAGLLRPRRSSPTGRSSSTSRPRSSAPRGLHLDDRHIRHADGAGFSASIVDADAVRRQQPGARCAAPARRWCCICRRFRPPRKRRCGTTS